MAPHCPRSAMDCDGTHDGLRGNLCRRLRRFCASLIVDPALISPGVRYSRTPEASVPGYFSAVAFGDQDYPCTERFLAAHGFRSAEDRPILFDSRVHKKSAS